MPNQARVHQVKDAGLRIKSQFKASDWSALASTLESFSRLAQFEGKKELSMRSQGLMEILGHRGGGRLDEAGPRVAELMEGLMSELARWNWELEHEGASANLSKSRLTH